MEGLILLIFGFALGTYFNAFVDRLKLEHDKRKKKQESSGMLNAFVEGIKQANKNILDAYDESEKKK
jgi:hypothetical protein